MSKSIVLSMVILIACENVAISGNLQSIFTDCAILICGELTDSDSSQRHPIRDRTQQEVRAQKARRREARRARRNARIARALQKRYGRCMLEEFKLRRHEIFVEGLI